MENSINICWNLGKVEKSKMKSGKFLKNMLEFGESGKIW